MIKTVKASKLLAQVVALTQKYPNATYCPPTTANGFISCNYFAGVVKDGPEQAGCIVGQALQLLGFTASDCSNTADVHGLVADGNIIQDHKLAVPILKEIQCSQDGGMSWGLCLQNAIDAFSSEKIDEIINQVEV